MSGFFWFKVISKLPCLQGLITTKLFFVWFHCSMNKFGLLTKMSIPVKQQNS